jgi:hypothetical protein
MADHNQLDRIETCCSPDDAPRTAARERYVAPPEPVVAWAFELIRGASVPALAESPRCALPRELLAPASYQIATGEALRDPEPGAAGAGPAIVALRCLARQL